MIVRPTPVFSAGNHHHLKKLRLLTNPAVRNDEGWSMLASVSILQENGTEPRYQDA